MKINKQWNSNTQEWENIPKTEKTKGFGESETDRSKFRPNVSRLNNIAGASNTTQGIYEFADGVDTGDRYYALRSPALDVTERQEWVNNIKTKGEEAMNDLRNNISEKLAEMQAQNDEKIENNTMAKATVNE